MSCHASSPLLQERDEELGRYYLTLAKDAVDEPIDARVQDFLMLEKGLIESPDEEFRFHSGG